MASKSFVHLHTHTEFSPLDGMSRVDELFDVAKSMGMPGIAITDHQGMAAMIQAAKAAKRTGLNFIPGNEAYHVKDAKNATNRGSDKGIYHMTLLAKNLQGYQDLLKLNSQGWENEHIFNDKPMIDNDMLAPLAKHLIGTSGCMGSMISQALLQEDLVAAERLIGEHVDIFGKDNYFIEIMSHGMKEDALIIPQQVKLAKRMGLRLLATNDSHYTREDQAHAHEAILAIGTGVTLNDPTPEEGGRRMTFGGSGYHLRSPEEMRELFPDNEFPGACDNTLLVNEMVNVEIPHEGQPFHLPDYPLEGTGFDTQKELLRDRVYTGLKQFHADEDGKITKEAIDRAEMELEIINDMGFPGYFLVVGDCLTYVKKRGFPVGPGRGSGAGSIVNQCLNITTIDPLRYGLPFSRFLNRGRIDSPPDIDSDLTNAAQLVLFAYASHKFGADKVARIANYTLLKGKSAIKDAARALDYSPAFAMKLNKDFWVGQGGKATIHDVILGNRNDLAKDDKRSYDEAQSMRDYYASDRDAKKVYDLAMDIEGIFRQFGVHAGGLVVSPTPIWDYTAIRRKKGDDVAFTQFDKTEVEKAGLVKIDFLGLENLNHISTAVRIVNRDLGEDLDINRLPLDDRATYSLIQSGDLDGIFQVGTSPGMQEFVVRMKPTNFDHLSAAIALYRPGPMSANAHMDYADRKNGRQAITTLHPDLNDLLEDTFGLIVYQEQVMSISMKFAGFDEIKADDFRSAMGKKKVDKMAAMRIDWNAGFKANGYNQKLADDLWNLVEPFSGYAFNKSHSVAYGMLVYQTAYLKANYPAQFAAAFIENSGKDKVVSNVEWARKIGIKVFAPDVNRSTAGPATSRDTIWLGLGNVTGISAMVIDGIVNERIREGNYTSVQDVVAKVVNYKLNVKAIEALAKSGAFDGIGASRKQVVERSGEILNAAKDVANDSSGVDLFGFMDEVQNSLDMLDLSGDDYSEREKLEMEYEVMGFFGSKHPWELYADQIKEAISLGVIPANSMVPDQIAVTPDLDGFWEEDKSASVYGILMGYKASPSKHGVIEKFTLETSAGQALPVVMFSKSRRVFDTAIGKPVVVTGKLLTDAYAKEEVRQIKATEYEPIDVEGSSKRGGLRAVGGNAPRSRARSRGDEPSPSQEKSRPTPGRGPAPTGGTDAAADRFRRRRGGAESTSAPDELSSRRARRITDAPPPVTEASSNVYTFRVSSEDELGLLAGVLNRDHKHPGDDSVGSTIEILFHGELVSLPIEFGRLSIMDTQDIEGETGAILMD